MDPRRATLIRLVAPPLVGGGLLAAMFLPVHPVGAVIVLSPYALFALTGLCTRSVAWTVLLALLAASSAWGYSAAGSSSTGGIVSLGLVPLQCGLAAVAVAGWLRDPRRPLPSQP